LREAAARYFVALAGGVGVALGRLGFRLCEGGFMASNRRWCQPVSTWRQYFRAWMDTPDPASLLHASLFFDLRPVAGDEPLARAHWEWVCARAPSQTTFLRYMARVAVDRRPPLGLFGGFVVDRSGTNTGRLDIKARGVFPLVQATRVYALSLGLSETNTVHRLARAADRGLLTEQLAQEVQDAYEVVSRIRLTHQLAQLDAGIAPDNFVDPRTLARTDRLLLRDAFRTLGALQQDLASRFQTNVIS
jgi:CBS domain-containing protein